jgi:hypothetical protein
MDTATGHARSIIRHYGATAVTRELTLTYLVDVMLDVACGIQPSALKAFHCRSQQMAVSRQALYAKLRRMEPPVSTAVVQQFSDLARHLLTQPGMLQQHEPVPGYRARIVDGTVLGGRSDHRIKPLRQIWSAGLTVLAPAVYAPAQRIVEQVVLAEDAYTGERALLDQLAVRAGEVWIGDRNFCVRSFLLRLHQAGAAFLVRWHASSCPFRPAEPAHCASGTRQGVVEQQVWLEHPGSHEQLAVRRIVLPLPTATRNGDTQLVLMTNLPGTIAADALCDAYRDRWQIEMHFQRLTQQLHCEPPALNYPRAALFAFEHCLRLPWQSARATRWRWCSRRCKAYTVRNRYRNYRITRWCWRSLRPGLAWRLSRDGPIWLDTNLTSLSGALRM